MQAERDRTRRNEKLAGMAMVGFVLALVSAGLVEYWRELDWKSGTAVVYNRAR